MEVKPMDVKKTQQIAVAPKEVSTSSWKARDLIGGIKDEFKKITWTSPEELKVYTQIVVGATFFFGMGIFLLDLCIQNILNGLAIVVRLISG